MNVSYFLEERIRPIMEYFFLASGNTGDAARGRTRQQKSRRRRKRMVEKFRSDILSG